MTQEKITGLMKSRLPQSQEPVFVVTMESLITAIVNRMGEQALTLTDIELQQIREEVQAAFSHYLDQREYIDIGLDAWEVVRTLEQ